ncbi:MAG TPA: HU family DNA-binding protein [Thermoanaerobaculales bacterium]|nr:HU family DNA-binding protein [Thermoanaerobaculales bacterium]HQL30478.1 HU family DNA-binding protein [Thermoanaerobaculales bacterium]HQP44338.1 HU family DNA-binding protein [Thermoanaerobaculales bacterium]
MTMTKADLVEMIAERSDLPRKQADEVVQVILDSIIGALSRGEKVELRGFGSFRIRRRGERNGRNPKTGDRVHVPPKRIPYFKPGKHLREELLQ